ncbi:transposon Tf2-1 polyprotein isoform X1 [Cucumis melo var. makuwa]|uniref:Transposon Tf2-1 polyprotein isoform X1 n=1 Tax=Cucumis melo var. makuwa TaxID=1194695 RepID=A0A5A7U0E3_CUCMM|nr:transposon Tf2-1 polyprotein isoform X1 [Cucumis melo var. makuwa]TYK31569.1 transposon Tf2-1 polyprotein isoform X1 [Cucumis melo var. makuwa]
MVQTRIEERLELIDQEIVGMKKEIGKMRAIELSLSDIMKNLEKQQQTLMMMMETIAKDRTVVGERTTESAAREFAIAKGKESEATSSKSADGPKYRRWLIREENKDRRNFS